jgi:hypothetical protein
MWPHNPPRRGTLWQHDDMKEYERPKDPDQATNMAKSPWYHRRSQGIGFPQSCFSAKCNELLWAEARARKSFEPLGVTVREDLGSIRQSFWSAVIGALIGEPGVITPVLQPSSTPDPEENLESSCNTQVMPIMPYPYGPTWSDLFALERGAENFIVDQNKQQECWQKIW